MEGVEVLLQPLLGRLAGVDRAAPEHRFSGFHDRLPGAGTFSPKNRGPDQRVP
jgi:hypothetical protein